MSERNGQGGLAPPGDDDPGRDASADQLQKKARGWVLARGLNRDGAEKIVQEAIARCPRVEGGSIEALERELYAIIDELSNAALARNAQYLRLHEMSAGWARTRGLNWHDAEEIVQEAILILLRKVEDERIETLEGYLHVIFDGLLLNFYRSSHHRKKAPSSPIEPMLTTDQSDSRGNSPTRKAEYREMRARLERVLNELPPAVRKVSRMSFLEEMSNEDVANLLGKSSETVANQLLKARTHIRQRFKEMGIVDGDR